MVGILHINLAGLFLCLNGVEIQSNQAQNNEKQALSQVIYFWQI
jgi:hypothetical protein